MLKYFGHIIYTRSSDTRRESAHLTWLYCTVQKAFQYKAHMDHECDRTLWVHLSKRQVANIESCSAFDSL